MRSGVFLLAFGAVTCAAAACAASVTVREEVLQHGLFTENAQLKTPEEYKAERENAPINEGFCESDIRYPRFEGMQDAAAQERLNAGFREYATGLQCPGVEVTDAAVKDAVRPTASALAYKVSYQDDALISVDLAPYSDSGGAHGNYSQDSFVVRLSDGHVMELGELVDMDKLAALNEYIFKALQADDRSFYSQENRTGNVLEEKVDFITPTACEGCTLSIDGKGLHIDFSPYMAGPYAVGIIEVYLPGEFIKDTLVREAVSQKKAL